MKIAVISPNSAHLEDIGRYLQTHDGARTVALHEGGITKARVVADQQRPDLIILDSMCRDLEGLPVLEYVSTQHPHTVIVMLCANHTPEFLIHAMRAGVREVLKSPVSKDVLLAAVERIEQRLGLAAKPREPGTIAAFIACKGGSGATFLATFLVLWLAAMPEYAAAVRGVTPGGTPVGSLAYACVCAVTALLSLVASSRAGRPLTTNPTLHDASRLENG